MSSTKYLFDSAGNWIAFQKGRFVYAPTGMWLGWRASSGNDVFDVEGAYLGTLHQDRFFRLMFPVDWTDSAHPGYPGIEEPADHPGYPGRLELPAGMEDVSLHEHA